MYARAQENDCAEKRHDQTCSPTETLDRPASLVLFSAHVDPRHVLRLLLLCDPFPGPELEACGRRSSRFSTHESPSGPDLRAAFLSLLAPSTYHLAPSHDHHHPRQHHRRRARPHSRAHRAARHAHPSLARRRAHHHRLHRRRIAPRRSPAPVDARRRRRHAGAQAVQARVARVRGGAVDRARR